jgi:hypothetical protein
MIRFHKFFICLCSLILIASQSLAKKNRDLPHHHSGVLNPYEAGPFDLGLESDDLAILNSGKALMKQPPPKEGELGGGAICVQDIEAPKEAVMAQILDMESYKGKVPKVNECSNYFVKDHEDGTHTIKTKMVVGVLPGYSVSLNYVCCFIEFYLSHHYLYLLSLSISLYSTLHTMTTPITQNTTL